MKIKINIVIAILLRFKKDLISINDWKIEYTVFINKQNYRFKK